MDGFPAKGKTVRTVDKSGYYARVCTIRPVDVSSSVYNEEELVFTITDKFVN